MTFLDEAPLEPEEQFIGLWKQAWWCHKALSAELPSMVARRLVGRLLKHGLQPTISAPHRGSHSCRIAQCSPTAGRRNEMDLAIECPLSPLLSYSVTHHHLRNIAVRALVRLIGPSLEHLDADDLHVKQLDVVIQTRHVPHEDFAASPRALGVLREHVPHFVEPSLRMKRHETSLKSLWRDRGGWRRPHRFEHRRARPARAPPPAADPSTGQPPQVGAPPRPALPPHPHPPPPTPPPPPSPSPQSTLTL